MGRRLLTGCVMVALAGICGAMAAHAQDDTTGVAPTFFDSTWTGSAEPFLFSGESRISGQLSDRQGSFQEIPRNYARFELVPTVAIYGAPFSASILLSTENSTARQRVNSVAFGFDYYKLQNELLQRAYEKVADLEELKAIEEAEGGIDRLRDSLSRYGEGKLRDLERLKDLASYESLRDRAISESMSQLESLGLVSATESFFMNFPALEVGVTYPDYTELTVRGVPVTGANIEFNPGLFYAAVAGGRSQGYVQLPGVPNLYRSSEFDQPEPSYERTLFAGRLGVGRREGSHFFLTSMYAIDDEATLPLDTTLLADTLLNPLTPKANYLFGIDSRLSIADDQVVLGAEISTAVMTGDVGSSGVQNDDIPGFVIDLIEPTVSTFVDFAYRINAAISIRETETKLNGSVRMVGPGYLSLGAPNLRNDLLSYEARIEQRLLRRQITLTGFFRNQLDNLIDWKPTTTTVGSFGVGLALNFRGLPYLRLNYAPYTQKNEFDDNTLDVNSETTVMSALAGYNYRTGTINNSTNVSYSSQRSLTSGLSESEYGVGTFSLNHSTFFPFNLSISGGLGLSTLESGAFSTEILSAEVSSSYTTMEILTLTAGLSLANEADVDSRFGFFGGAALSLWGYGLLDLTAEQNRYTGVVQSANDFDELLFRVGLTTSW